MKLYNTQFKNSQDRVIWENSGAKHRSFDDACTFAQAMLREYRHRNPNPEQHLTVTQVLVYCAD